MTPEKVKLAARLMQDPAVSVDEICRTLRVSRATLYRHVSPTGEVRSQSSRLYTPGRDGYHGQQEMRK
jgi:hypothetical protein